VLPVGWDWDDHQASAFKRAPIVGKSLEPQPFRQVRIGRKVSSERSKIDVSAFDDRFRTSVCGCPLRTTVWHHVARAIVLLERRRVNGGIKTRWDSEMAPNATGLMSLDMSSPVEIVGHSSPPQWFAAAV
jgi:hypothetical protein